MVLYDKIGVNYNATRAADPYITDVLYRNLAPAGNGLYLDIGCGTGNYLKALSDKGLRFYGIDPSDTMLQVAARRNEHTTFIKGTAEDIPLPANFFDGATAVLTIHHWNNISKGLQELYRVLKPEARLAFFSFTPDQMRGYWLYHYFPQMIENCTLLIPEQAKMEQLLTDTGFSLLQTEKYFIRPDLQDHFMYSNKFNPSAYLSAQVRNNASAFSAVATQEEVEAGVSALARDITTGKIEAIIHEYENDLGDYLFLTAVKPA